MLDQNAKPTEEIDLREVFGLDSDMKVKGFAEKTDRVPEIDSTYKFDPDTTMAILAGFAYNRRVMIQGYHGTGKSTHIEQVAARLNWPCIRVNLDSHISRIDLVGKDAIVLKEGKQVTEFREGILPWALQRPVALVFDEYDAGRPDVMFVIQRVLEVAGKLTLLDQNRVIRPHSHFRLFSTTNTIGLGDTTGLYHGTQQINQGQMDRWSIVTTLNYLPHDKEVEIEVSVPGMSAEILAPPGMEELTGQLQSMFQNIGGGKRKSRKLKISEAMKLLTDEEAAKMVNEEELKLEALRMVEQNGIVFLDEIDKIATRSDSHGADVSRQGVQRDLLPLVEGTTISTKYGMIKTDHILFIASGAFHLSRPSDLIPELQGRFPIRVELESLSVEDFERILTQTDACLTRQYEALLATDGVSLEFAPEGIRRLAEIAFQVNEKTENIGARRLYTVMEKLLEELAFEAGKAGTQKVLVDAAYVDDRLQMVAQREDLARYVL
jgi:cobaltochelatase CobS subunit